MLTVHEDERQKQVALQAAHHAFTAMFLSSLGLGLAGRFILKDDDVSITAMGLLLVALVVYHVSLWRGGRFEYAREMTNRTPGARLRARRQALRYLGALWAWLFVFSYFISHNPLDEALFSSAAGMATTAALVWWFYLRRLPAGD